MSKPVLSSSKASAIGRAFSRAAASYSSVAGPQQSACEQLGQLLVSAHNIHLEASEQGHRTTALQCSSERESSFAPSFQDVLDLGSGPTPVSACFSSLGMSLQTLVSVDVSGLMLRQASDEGAAAKSAGQKNRHFAVQASFDSLCFAKESFDLIASNFALQWSDNLAELFSQAASLLKPSGLLAFALPVEPSLQDLREQLKSFGIEALNDLPSETEVLRALEVCSGIEILEQTRFEVCEAFQSPYLALGHLKALGATQRDALKNKSPGQNFAALRQLRSAEAYGAKSEVRYHCLAVVAKQSWKPA